MELITRTSQCGRCRKRKIKCSGDPGNGTGCNNCKSAGADMGQCQFLRVQSQTPFFLVDQQLTHGHYQVNSIDCPTSTGSVWPYTSSGSVSASAIPQIGSSMGSYSMGQVPSLAPMTPGSFTASSHYPRTTSGHSYAYSAQPSRHAYTPAYGLSYGDDLSDAYSQQSPPYMLPSQDTLGTSNVYGSQEALRTWNPISQSSKIPHSGLFLDQDSPPSYGLSQLSYLSSSVPRQSAVTTDASSFFPAMTSLVSSLPMAGSNGDRTLPNPAAGRAHIQQASMNGYSQGNNAEAIPLNPYGSSQAFAYKSTAPWGSESVTSGGSQSSASTMSGANVLMDSSKSSTTNQQETAFGYIALPGSPPADLSAPTMVYNTPRLSNSVTNPSHPSSAVSSLPRTSSRDSLLQSHGSSSNLYSYSADTTSKRGSVGDSTTSDGTLVSGQQYTRLRQPQFHHTASPDAHRRDSFESRSRGLSRTSISSINNARGY